jgi:hypothetical protein
MATIKELKDFLSQFPDDMETDIDITTLEPWKLELLELMERCGYNKTLEKYNKKNNLLK